MEIKESEIIIKELGEDMLHTYAEVIISKEKLTLTDARELRKYILYCQDRKDYVEIQKELINYAIQYGSNRLSKLPENEKKAEKWDKQKYICEQDFDEVDLDITEEQYEKFSSALIIMTWIANELANQDELEQENRRLKEELSKTVGDFINLKNELEKVSDKLGNELQVKELENERLRQQLRDLEESMDYEPDLLERLVLTKKVEKIKELVNSSKPFEYIVFQIHQEIKE